jgi:hypothetical protein
MNWYILFISLYVTCLVGIMFLLLLVTRKHIASKKPKNVPDTPAWQFRAQETLSLLTWVRRTCAVVSIQTVDRQ